MSDIQQDLLSAKEPGLMSDYITFGENSEYRAHKSGLIETRKQKNGQGKLLDYWRPCATNKYKTDKNGGYYWSVQAKFGAKGNPRTHVVMCTLFHGPRPSLKHQVNHINGNRDDNSAENLEWCTAAENIANAKARGAFDFEIKGPSFLEDDICRLLAVVTQLNAHIPNSELSRRYGPDLSEFSKIKTGSAKVMKRYWYILNYYNNTDIFGADLPVLKSDWHYRDRSTPK